MYELSLLLAGIIANISYYIKPKVIVKDREVIVKDPNGLIKGDIEYLKSRYGNPIQYTNGISMEDIARQQGHHDVLQFIENYKREGPKDTTAVESNRKRGPRQRRG
jgi:hypothetical protein